jgi:hypothetical protein
MRKSVSWVVYPRSTSSEPDIYIIQSDHRICRINTQTKKGMLSKHCANYPIFIMMEPFMGATEVDIPQDVLDAIVMCLPSVGDEIGPGVTIGG